MPFLHLTTVLLHALSVRPVSTVYPAREPSWGGAGVVSSKSRVRRSVGLSRRIYPRLIPVPLYSYRGGERLATGRKPRLRQSSPCPAALFIRPIAEQPTVEYGATALLQLSQHHRDFAPLRSSLMCSVKCRAHASPGHGRTFQDITGPRRGPLYG